MSWPEGAEAWVHAALAPASVRPGDPRIAPRSWSVDVSDGDRRWYFKEDRSHGPCEAAVLARLALRRPAAIAPVVAVDEDRGWSLTADAGPALRAEDPTSMWCAAVRTLGDLQVAEAAHARDWHALGCRDLTGDRLLAAIHALFEAAEPALEPAIHAALRSLMPRIEAACATLVSGVRLGTLERTARIILPGGPLDITWDEASNHVLMTGPAELERTGKAIFHADGGVSFP